MKGGQSSDKQGKEGEQGDSKSHEKESKSLLPGKRSQNSKLGGDSKANSAGWWSGSRKRLEKQPQEVKALTSNKTKSKQWQAGREGKRRKNLKCRRSQRSGKQGEGGEVKQGKVGKRNQASKRCQSSEKKRSKRLGKESKQ